MFFFSEEPLLLTMPLNSPTKKPLPAKRSSVRTALRTSRSVSRYNPAQSPSEIALDNSEKVNQPSQSPPEIAHEQLLDNQLSSQLTTSRRSASTSRIVISAPVRDDVCRDVLINSPPASAVCTSISMDATSITVETFEGDIFLGISRKTRREQRKLDLNLISTLINCTKTKKFPTTNN